jgi:hypothetical protein
MRLVHLTATALLVVALGAAVTQQPAQAAFVINGIISSGGAIQQPLSRTPGDSFDVTVGTAEGQASFDGTLGGRTAASGFGDSAGVTLSYSSDYTLVGAGAVSPTELSFIFDLAGTMAVTGLSLGDGGAAGYKVQVGGVVDAGSFSCQNLIDLNFGRPIMNCAGIASSTDNTTVALTIAKSIAVTLPSSGTLNMQFQTSASTLGQGSADSNFLGGLSLLSVTVPDTFIGDISGLRVVFDSGLQVPVTRAGSGDAVVVPEPTTLALLGGPILLLGLLRRKVSVAR